MAVGLTVAAVIAHHGRLDEAGSIGVGARGQREHAVARVEVKERGGGWSGSRHLAAVSSDSVSYKIPQFLLRHGTRSTVSMMPITAASTGASLRPSASPAARPSMTIRTFSWTPAPSASTASTAVPRG